MITLNWISGKRKVVNSHYYKACSISQAKENSLREDGFITAHSFNGTIAAKLMSIRLGSIWGISMVHIMVVQRHGTQTHGRQKGHKNGNKAGLPRSHLQ